MRSRYRISLNNVHLDSLDSNLMILDIAYGTPEIRINQDLTNALDGFDYKREVFNRQTVTVTFELHIYDVAKRNAACQAVNAWAAAGGTLRTNDRENQQLLNVRCSTFAAVNARDWTKPLTLEFTTTYNPYWQSRTLDSLVLTGKSVKGNLNLSGNTGEALVSVDVTAQEAITSFTITAGEKTLTLKGISVPKNGQLVISYLRSRYLRIRATNANGSLSSIMSKLDPASDDNLSVPCGVKTLITVKASGKVSCSVSARGLWV